MSDDATDDGGVGDLTARLAEQAARGAAARRGIESVAAMMEDQAARLPIESDVRTLFIASALVLRHGVESDDPAVLEAMVKASHWLVRGMVNPPDE